MRNARLLIASLAIVALASAGEAAAKTVSQKQKALKPVQDTTQVVTKNSDGTVEVSDAPANAPKPGVTYKPAPPGTIHYADGVVVHRNADGSVDVSDEDSAHPAIHSLGSVPAPGGATATAHHATTHSAKHAAHSSSKQTKKNN